MLKNLIFALVLTLHLFVMGQHNAFDKNYFQNKLTELAKNEQVFTNITVKRDFNNKPNNTESVVLEKRREFVNQFSYEPLNIKLKKIPKMIDYNDTMQCGPLQLRRSEDMMVGAIVDYVVNKYIFGSFMKTSYN
jgi:hypothetical protein